MPYGLSFAGVTLPLSTPELEERLARVHPQNFLDADLWQYAGFSLDQLPTPSLPRPPHLRPGVLHWPTGACRVAWFHAVVNTTRLDAIRAAVGDPMTPKALLARDGRTGKTITASMYLLPARPLNQLGIDLKDGWLLTLADRRFYDYWRSGTVTSPASWTALFSSLGAILGSSITVDTVESAYGTPSGKWTQYYQPTPAVLDAAASQIGHRVVYGLDGTISTKRWQTAKAASDALLASAHAVSGGYLDPADIARYVPASVNVLFATATNPALPFAVNKTLSSLSISEYGSSTGVAGTQGTTFADLAYTVSNITAVNTYAAQAASDWYGWRLADVDVVIPGIEPWVPTGWEDHAEWTYQSRQGGPFASTLVRREPWDELPAGGWYAGLTPIPSDWIAPGGSGTPGSGSGSGSGTPGCSEAVTPVEFACVSGMRTATVRTLGIGIEDNTLVVVECAEETADLGPCSPSNPDGTTLPVVVMVCPVFETIDYLDHASAPQTKRVVVGIQVRRKLVRVAIADAEGCDADASGCCPGSGGGGPAECTQACGQCPGGVSTEWTLTIPGRDPVSLFYVDDPDDGNGCRWASDDLAWQLSFDPASNLWVIENFDTGEFYFIPNDEWLCAGPNELTNLEEGGDAATVTSEFDCSTVSYDCVDGGCVGVAGAGGTYATLAECEAVCVGGGVLTECCGAIPTPLQLYAHFSGALSAVGTVPLTYDTVPGAWMGDGNEVCSIGSIRFECAVDGTWAMNAGPAASVSNADETSCSPFEVTMSGTGFICSGAFTVVVNEIP